MTLDEINQGLAELATTGDPAFTDAANFVAQLTEQIKAGEMSAAEYTETLQDVQRQMSIVYEMRQLAYKEQLNTLINGLISIASVV